MYKKLEAFQYKIRIGGRQSYFIYSKNEISDVTFRRPFVAQTPLEKVTYKQKRYKQEFWMLNVIDIETAQSLKNDVSKNATNKTDMDIRFFGQ